MAANLKSALLHWPREPVRPVAPRREPLNIALVSINYHPEPTGIAVYSTGMAEFFSESGHQIMVYTAFPYYPAWRLRPDDRGRVFAREQIEGVNVRRNFIYVPQHLSALRRILHELSFTLSAGARYLLGPRAEVTVVVSPPLLLATVIGLLARLLGSKVVLHVQDLQPDAAVDLGMLHRGYLTRLLFAIERLNYRIADRVSTISLAMQHRIESKGVAHHKTLILKNWADTFPEADCETDTNFRELWDLGERFVVLYAGNMGVKQGLDSLLDSAAALRHDADCIFVIVGDGGEKAKLTRVASERNLTNIRFRMPVPKDQLGALLRIADIAVIPQKANINDLVLPSKIGNLMSCGTPVVVAAERDSELAQMVRNSGCGLVCAPEDGGAMADAVQVLKHDPVRRRAMAICGREYALAELGKQAILKRFEAQLYHLVDRTEQPLPASNASEIESRDTVAQASYNLKSFDMTPVTRGNAFAKTPGWPLNVVIKRILWAPCRLLFVAGTTRFLSPLRVVVLRVFGARIGRHALICAGVKIWYPWNLTMGSRTTLGPDVEVYNFAPVILGDDATVSQYSYLCTASHDYSDPAMPLTYRSITVGAKAWIAASSFVGPGVSVGEGAVVGACSVVTRDVCPWMVVAGNPVREIKPRMYRA